MSHTRRSSRRTRTALATAAAAVAAVLAISGCSAGGSATDADSDGGGTITVGQKQPVGTLDPATAAPPTYVFPAYEPLIYQQPDGSLIPALATEWGYTDDTNTVFELTVREGVTFSDGSELDAEAVKASLERFLALEDNTNKTYAGPVESIEATDESTVQITYSEAFPVAAVSLTQDWRFGLIVSPDGLADAESLNTETHGAGQYTLDPDATVDGSEYTFVANENYWNPDAVKFDKVVLKVISDTAAQLAALESGEIDYANNAPTLSVVTALEEGFQNSPTSGGVWTLMLVNREEGPLADARVREAISLALDRAPIAEAVFSGRAEAISSVAQEGQVGYYDPAEIEQDIEGAKELLAEAGYPDGVTISLLDIDGIDPNYSFATAVQSQLAEAGITVELIQASGAFENFVDPLYAMEADAAVWQFSNIDTYYQFLINFLPAGSLANPAGSVDETLNELIATAASAPEEEYDAAMQAVAQYYDELYWTVPVSLVSQGQLFSTEIGNLPEQNWTQSLNMFSPDPDTSVEFAE